MNIKVIIAISGLVLLTCLTAVATETESEATPAYQTSWFWMGGHYTDFEDYSKKVGEYMTGEEEAVPELKFYNFSARTDRLMEMKAHYFDDEDIDGSLTGAYTDRFSAALQYRSMIRQIGQDLLENMNAREYFPSTAGFGGKTLTHEINDPDADYHYKRQEVLSNFQVLLARQNNLKFIAQHRSIIQRGNRQMLANSHCFSCHLQSKTATVDKQTHAVEAGLQADASDFTVGYDFKYRYFASDAMTTEFSYDSARHPANPSPTTAQEFRSRQVYADTVLPVGTLPKTTKTGHKFRLKGDLGKGYLSSSFAYNIATNDNNDLSATTLAGAVNYNYPLSPRSRLLFRGQFTSIDADDYDVDLPAYREGQGSGPVTSFDDTRKSSLNRTVGKGTLEYLTRLNRKLTLAALVGYESVNRKDYPDEDGLTSNTFIGQVKLRFRKGLRYSNSLKYRFEKTSDPFVSGKGLFEQSGREIYERPYVAGATFKFIFYYEREAWRYQSITTEPTDYHEVTWMNTWRPNMKTSMNLGLKFKYDKNGDLDSLDVKHMSFQPNVNLNYMVNDRLMVTTGYTYSHYKSRGPVTVALFDG